MSYADASVPVQNLPRLRISDRRERRPDQEPRHQTMGPDQVDEVGLPSLCDERRQVDVPEVARLPGLQTDFSAPSHSHPIDNHASSHGFLKAVDILRLTGDHGLNCCQRLSVV